MSSDYRVLISGRSAEDKLSLALSDDVGAVRHLRRRPDAVIITVARPSAGRPIAVELLQVLAVQTLRAGLLERGIALALPLHRAQLAGGRLPIVGEVSRRAGDRVLLIPVASGRALARREAGRCVRVIVGGVLVRRRWRRPQGRRRHRHVDCFRLPVPIDGNVTFAVPAADRDPVVVECPVTLRQRAHVLIRQAADAGTRTRVGVQVLLVVHDAVHRVLASGLAHRAASRAGASRAVPRDDGTSLHPTRRHRLRRHAAVVLDRRLRLGVLDAVQRPRLLLLSLSSYCRRNREREKGGQRFCDARRLFLRLFVIANQMIIMLRIMKAKSVIRCVIS